MSNLISNITTQTNNVSQQTQAQARKTLVHPKIQATDTFEHSAKEQTSSNNKKKWLFYGAGILTAALVAIKARKMVLGKTKTKSEKDINKIREEIFNKIKETQKTFKPAQKITFKKAKTIEEAKIFARDNFNTQIYDIQDLSLANYINKSITIANNKMKGQLQLPNTITIQKSIDETYPNISTIAFSTLDDGLGYTLGICEAGLKTLDKRLQEAINENLVAVLPKTIGKTRTDLAKKLIQKYKAGKATIADKFQLYDLNNEVCTKLLQPPKQPTGFTQPNGKSTSSSIIHELMHLHRAKKNNQIVTGVELSAEQKVIANKVSDYATMDSEEFLCETFAGLMSGSKYSDDVIQLYKELGGDIYPAFAKKINPTLG